MQKNITLYPVVTPLAHLITLSSCFKVATLRLALKACLARLSADKALVFDDGEEVAEGSMIGSAPSSPLQSPSKAGGKDSSALLEPEAEVACGPLSHEEWDRLLGHK